jgi:hypothetical protein
MAATVYRYKQTGPNVNKIAGQVPGAISLTATGNYFIDVTADSAYKADLDDVMAAQGWTYVSTAPTDTPAAAAATAGVDAISFYDEGGLLAKQPALNFIGTGVTAVNNNGANRVDVTIPGGASVTANAPANVNAAVAAVGVGTAAARDDHKHSIDTAAPSDIGSANAAGTSNSLVRADHVHNLPFSAVQTALGAASSAVGVNSQKITGLADPTAAQDAATKAYVDATATGLDLKASVRAIATGAITLSGTQTIDGVAVIAGDRVLVAGQASAATNGIYVVAAGAWSRATDADVSAEVTAGLFTFVTEGTVNADTGWVLTTNDPITLGTTALAFTQFSGAGGIIAGTGLTKTGNTVNVIANADGSIVANADDIQVGVLATDAQHGTRGGGTLHANVVAAGAAGFMTGADKTKLDGLPTTPQSAVLLWGDSSVGTSTTQRFLEPGYTANTAPVSPVAIAMPKAGTVRNLRVVHNAAGTGASNITYTVRKNGVATALTAVVANTATSGSDVTHSFTVAAGDTLDVSVDKSASLSTSPSAITVTAELAP